MRTRRVSPTLVAVPAVAALVLAAGESRTGPEPARVRGTPQEEARLHGEYGLWVQESDDSMAVAWIAREPGAGYLRVLVDGRPVFQAETEPSSSHRAVFRKPAAASMTLQYGVLGDPEDEHETVIYFDLPQRPIQTEFENVDTIFVVGDVHGEYDRLTELFRNAELVDEELRWTGGHSHLVLLGDLVDRGPDVVKTLWFLYELERDAARRGGRVQVMLGNHEIMAMIDDTRYVSSKERLVARFHGAEYWRLFDPRSSILGKWLASKPALIRIDDVLLAHGGVGPAYAGYSIPEFDDSLALFMSEDWFFRLADTTAAYEPMDSVLLFRRIDFFFADNSVFWYRGYVATDTLAAVLNEVLDGFRSEIHVVGHTPVDSIRQTYDGALIAVDLEEAASQMLMLVRASKSYERYRCSLSGPPQPLPLLELAGTER
ncbi:MAG: metallophosphoesterase [Gemmatimonadota bacterium]|nr:MAG: metallophosphoesterase [Gemmatimonadota bacterium]